MVEADDRLSWEAVTDSFLDRVGSSGMGLFGCECGARGRGWRGVVVLEVNIVNVLAWTMGATPVRRARLINVPRRCKHDARWAG